VVLVVIFLTDLHSIQFQTTCLLAFYRSFIRSFDERRLLKGKENI